MPCTASGEDDRKRVEDRAPGGRVFGEEGLLTRDAEK